MSTSQTDTAAARYEALRPERDVFLDRARAAAELTLPMLIPPAGSTSASQFSTPFQSVGARGANNLSSRLLTALFPANQPFFRFVVDQGALEAGLAAQGAEDAAEEVKAAVDEGLSKVEAMVMEDVAASGDRTVLGETLKHLVVGGNVMFFTDEKAGSRMYPLEQYVSKRDPMGRLLESVIREEVAPAALDPEFLKRLPVSAEGKDASAERSIELFTHLKRDGDQFHVYQECRGEEVPGTYGTYPVDASPFIPLRLTHIAGEDYGRSYVEEYLGDLKSLEGLTQSIVEGAAAAARLLTFVRPGATTRVRDVAEARNGDVLTGTADDVTHLQMNKFQDFRVALEMADRIEKRLEYAFLLNSAIQRTGERVTAEEIRYMAQELEATLGGVYSILAEELQLRYVRTKINSMQRDGRIAELPEDIVKPVIVTGLEALGRGHDRDKLTRYVATASDLLGPEEAVRRIDAGVVLKRLAQADGIDPKGLVLDDNTVASSEQRSQLMALVDRLGPDVIKQMGTGTAAGSETPISV